ncbi:MAG: hypothetical protein H8E85_02080 [Candidatus Marinimicrobia bacterium]|nr:hypothetical protein [Candidatus Neomarinimicrobiota bacterium]
MKKDIFLDNRIFSTTIFDKKIDIDFILEQFHNNSEHYTHTHFINNRWENIYLDPQKIPSVLPLLSKILSKAIDNYRTQIKPHQTLVIPHELLGYEKNEFWFNLALPGESTAVHNHNGKAVISGVYYLQVTEKCGNVVFINEKKEKMEVPAKCGQLLFFPPDLDHYVQENKGTDKRISLSFNCYLFPLIAPTN